MIFVGIDDYGWHSRSGRPILSLQTEETKGIIGQRSNVT